MEARRRPRGPLPGLLALLLLLRPCGSQTVSSVVCVGDSITYGRRLLFDMLCSDEAVVLLRPIVAAAHSRAGEGCPAVAGNHAAGGPTTAQEVGLPASGILGRPVTAVDVPLAPVLE